MEVDNVYKSRVVDSILRDQLEAAGVVLIQGPKWCGKTTTALQQARSVIYLNDPEQARNLRLLAQTSISSILEGDTPRLLDEWQLIPQLWDAARFTVDRRSAEGQFIFTGSAVPADKSKISHTGTGRFAWVTMRPMSLWESGDSIGVISLSDLFLGKSIAHPTPNNPLLHMAYLACRGGWPKAVTSPEKVALKQSYNYVDAVTEQEISQVDGVGRDKVLAKKLLRSYARSQGTQTSVADIVKDISSTEHNITTEVTIQSYIKALEKIFVIENMSAWNPNLRSKTAIRTSDTRYFVDPSIATAALRIGPEDLLTDLNTFGFIFETLAVRDLRVYADALDGDVFHYRDKDGLECDAVLHLRNGRYGLIEIKLGGEDLIESGVASLLALNKKIDTTKMLKPSFMMVLTAVGSYAYQREDGVWIVPIDAIKP